MLYFLLSVTFLFGVLPLLVRWWRNRGALIDLDAPKEEGTAAYEMRPLKAPFLVGIPLKIFSELINHPFVHAVLTPKLLHDSGFSAIRRIVTHHAPALHPVPVSHYNVSDGALIDRDELQSVLEKSDCRNKESFRFETIRDFNKAYRSGDVTPVDVVKRLRERLEASADHKRSNAIRAVKWDEALHAAKASAERWASNKPLSPLDGVLVGVKNEVDVAGYATTNGTVQPSFCEPVVDKDATCVARLRAAGAIVFCTLNMYEIGIAPCSWNKHYGAVRNPYNLEHNSSGSSSGSGAAVASGLMPIAIGTDGGGSVRLPAAFNGVFGLKPTASRIPTTQTTKHLAFSVGVFGPLAATADDMALMYGVMAGADPAEPTSLLQPRPSLQGYGESVRNVRIGVYWPWFNDADDETVEANQDLLDALKKSGAKFVDIDLPHLEELRIAHVVAISTEMASSMFPERRDSQSLFAADVNMSLAVSDGFSALDYVQSCRVRAYGMHMLEEVFERCDVIMTPMCGILPPKLPAQCDEHGVSDLNTTGALLRFAGLANFLGIPAVSVPCGYSETGLPIGAQFQAKWWNEQELLRVARVCESLLTRRAPKVHLRVLE